MQCPRCGMQQPDGLAAAFCPSCGAPMNPAPGNLTEKQALAAQIGQVEMQLAKAEQDIRFYAEREKRGQGSATGGLVAVILGVLAFFFLNAVWGVVGIGVGALGALSIVDGLIRRGLSRRKREKIEEALIPLRGQLAQMRAQMMM